MGIIKVLHVIPTLSPRFGGPLHALNAIIEAQIGQPDINATLLTTDIGVPESPVQYNSIRVIVAPAKRIHPFYYAPSFNRDARQAIRSCDIVHIHGLWNYPDITAALESYRQKKPAILRPCGTLMREKFVRKRLKKAVGYHLVIRRVLRSITRLHFATRMEREKSSWLTAGVNSEVIPLPVVPVSPLLRGAAVEELRGILPSIAKKKVVLFLGRLSWLKGIEILCDAMSRVVRESNDVLLVIAGPDDEGIGESVAKRCGTLGIENHTAMIGSVDPTRRAALLSISEVFVLPSLSENFSMALVEAMSAGVPVVTTDGVGASEYVRDFGAGRVTGRNSNEIADTVLELLRSDKKRLSMGSAGKRMVATEFSPDKIADKLLSLYKRTISSTQRVSRDFPEDASSYRARQQ